MHTRSIVTEFTAQAEGFNTSDAATDVRVLDAIVQLAAPEPHERWLEAACGPGVVTRRLAPSVASVQGYDVTPKMIELARREAAAAGLSNVSFAAADTTALPEPDAGFDGVVVRSALHHIPVPVRLLTELARVVKPGGKVILADHLADADPTAAAWALELERLRDPSHWASLSLAQAHGLIEPAGLTLDYERFVPLVLDFENWLDRGGADEAARAIIEQGLTRRPPHVTCFEVGGAAGERTLRLRMWLARLRRPVQRTPSRSTTNTSVSSGPIAPGTPRLP